MENLGRRLLVLLVVGGAMMLMWWSFLPEPDPDTLPETGWLVTFVIDGDTIVVSRDGVEETVRFIGIDTPERDECGYEEARQFLVDVIDGVEVVLLAEATTDRDTHGRLLRYVEYGGYDVGLAQIGQGFAVARYDSRTNQPHPREDIYREADAEVEHICGVVNR